MNLPSALTPLFWDTRPGAVDTETHAFFVLERILEYGSLAAVRWAVQVYGTERIKTFLRQRGARVLSAKTLSFWTMLLSLEDEECFQRSSRSRSRPFWNY